VTEAPIEALLLDLGNVVMEIDISRTFRHWASWADVDETTLHERWTEDGAYQAHERGELSFSDYVAALGERLQISLPAAVWEAGWNDLFVGPYASVQRSLSALAGRLPLCAFTNTNPTHELASRSRFADALVHFDEIYVSSRIGLRKPDRAAFEWVTAAMGVAPERILFLDDNRQNVAGAEAAGLQAVWIRSEADVVSALARF